MTQETKYFYYYSDTIKNLIFSRSSSLLSPFFDIVISIKDTDMVSNYFKYLISDWDWLFWHEYKLNITYSYYHIKNNNNKNPQGKGPDFGLPRFSRKCDITLMIIFRIIPLQLSFFSWNILVSFPYQTLVYEDSC